MLVTVLGTMSTEYILPSHATFNLLVKSSGIPVISKLTVTLTDVLPVTGVWAGTLVMVVGL